MRTHIRRALLFVITGAILLQASAPLGAQSSGALSFFKNYFITGDYVVGGVGLYGQGINGTATGSIQVDGVPAGADISAAYLYWQVVSKGALGSDPGNRGVTFKGHALSSAEGPFGKVLGSGTAACAEPGIPTSALATFSYRADVLRFFDVDQDTGKLSVNGAHQVQLPDGGGPIALGASLVVIYRDPDSGAPLSAVVLYDGGYTMNEITQGMSQTIQGFYDAADNPSAKLTHIVGGGQLDESENLLFNDSVIAVNPFRSAQGAKWDNPTWELTPDSSLRQVTTSANRVGIENFDCLTWAAIIYKTTVRDTDNDGLLDLWESSDEPILDPNGQPLPNLKAMGAHPDQKDLFIEVGYMYAQDDEVTGPPTYGGVPKPAHAHVPDHETLKLVGDAFANAPTGRVQLHVDVGTGYEPGVADEYIIRGPDARGGEAIDETTTVCARGPTDPPWVCQFSAHPGTVGWKSGFRFLRDEVLSGPVPLPGEDDPCDAPGNTCERRFDSNRLQSFHYALFAHAVGLPKSELPCLDANNEPGPTDVNDRCKFAENPDFRTPRTNTGIADFPGGDILLTLGGFSDTSGRPVGTPFMQASTLLHEFGHNAERRHGGEALEPNCKPTYLSTMNYLYQLRGLLDDLGRPHLDLSRDSFGAALDETRLADGLFPVPYRMGWYAPLATSYLAGRSDPARTHCDGSALLPTDVPMVRIDARTAAGPLDWNANDLVEGDNIQDINFNGRTTSTIAGLEPELLQGVDDWSRIRLNQIGNRRNVGGLYAVPGTNLLAVGPLSLDVGKGDLGKGDLGKGDLGKGDLGKGDLGKGDLGKGDLGKGDLGKGDLGKGDLGGGDLFLGDPNNPGGELDFETASDLARTPPTEFAACVIGVDCAGDLSQLHRVQTRWRTPNVGGVGLYNVYRVEGGTLVPGQPWTLVGQVPAVSGQTDYSLLDSTQLVSGAQYTYFAVAVYADGIASDPSNLVTITVPLANFTLVGIKNVPPPPGAQFNGGSAIPMAWQFTNGSTVVDSSHVAHVVTVRGPLPDGPIRTITNTDPGSSSFRYSSSTWKFNLQTREPDGQRFAAGVYDVTITPTTPGYGPSPTFQITVR